MNKLARPAWKFVAAWLLPCVLFATTAAATGTHMLTSPMLPGFQADPSICRVADDYYLVTSTVESFPGVPIFCSQDLVNWQPIGPVVARKSQSNLERRQSSQGICEVGSGQPLHLGSLRTRELATTTLAAQKGVNFNFTGVCIGVFTPGNGQRSAAPAEIDWFENEFPGK